MTYPLGVDIGTTYTAAALWREGRVQTVPLGNRANAVPSVLFLREDGSMLVGEAAARRGIIDPDRQAREFKRRMGDDIPILIGGRGMAAHQLTGEVLKFVIERVSESQGGPPRHVVLTHPAAWGDYRKNLLTQAAVQGGLHEVGLLPEPVAAATWYASQERIEPGSLIGIYDFGGGTFDASVVRKTATGVEIYGEAGGDDSIGGIDFDHALFRHVGTAAGVDVGQLDMSDQLTASAMAQVFASVVEAKEALSADVEAVVPVVLPGVSRQVLITRAEFEDLIRQRVLGTVGVFGQVVQRAGVDPSKLHGVLLVGGSSRIPLVRQLLSAELGIRVAVDAHPKYTVSLGAAIAAAPRMTGARSSATMTPPGPVRPMTPPGGIPNRQTQSRPYPTNRPPQPGYQPQYPPPQVGQRSQAGMPMPGQQRPMPGQQSQAGIPLPPPGQPPREPEPAVSLQVDLARSGLTGITDVRSVLAQITPSEPVTMTPPPRPGGGDNFTQFRTTEGKPSGGGKGRLIALLVVVIIVAVVAVLIFVLQKSSSNDSGSASKGSASSPVANPGGPSVGTISLHGQLVKVPDGGDQMTAVTGLPNGSAVAVGFSVDLQPRAWVAAEGGDFVSSPVDKDGQGKILDVTTLGSTVVGVGWTGVGNTTRAAVWTSGDGRTWNLEHPDGDFRPQSAIKQLSAVTVTADNKLLALARDDRQDKTDGDATAYTSADGKTWTPVQTTGLSGSGPQDIVRLIRSDNSFVALGTVLNGAKLGPAIWTSTDGAKWDSSPYVPQEGAPSPQGIVKQADGRLLMCGTVGSGNPPPLSCWTQKADQNWERWDVTADDGSPKPLLLYGMYPAGSSIVVVGLGQPRSGTGNDAAIWTLTVGQHK
ncbi:Hsp70 family protein [Actinocrispum wychmicini]|uniref:Hsp70 protein n=1 Tax=Actinocrispum wychmicini TaxID=1213861 RepID=A0A4R2J936_9PSEU|nr:Hsp70 family protein [Actinocrispum wychmicini]TCO55214.1 Hsp70 protein [Actinocrispum wychmicini]